MSDVRGEHGKIDGEALLDALLDGTLTGERRVRALRVLEEHPRLACEYVRLRGLLAQMDHDVACAPDLSGRILAEVGRRRGFLGGRLRKIGLAAQVAAGLALLVGIGAIALVQHARPELVVPEAASPVTMVVEAAQEDLGGSVRALVGETRRVVREDLAAPADRLGRRLARSADATFIMAGLGGLMQGDAERGLRWEVDASSSTMPGAAGGASGGVTMSTFLFASTDPSVHGGPMVDRGAQGVWVMGRRTRVVRLEAVPAQVGAVVPRASEFRLETARDEP